MKYLNGCTRVEIIDDSGRSYVNWNANNKVQISMQDGGKTLKVFISGSSPLLTRSEEEIDRANDMLHEINKNRKPE
jgi:hypothetical protein